MTTTPPRPWHKHDEKHPYLTSPQSVRYMARLAAQPEWVPPIQRHIDVSECNPFAETKARRVRHSKGGLYPSIVAAAKALKCSQSVIRKCIEDGQYCRHGMFYAATEAEWMAYQERKAEAA